MNHAPAAQRGWSQQQNPDYRQREESKRLLMSLIWVMSGEQDTESVSFCLSPPVFNLVLVGHKQLHRHRSKTMKVRIPVNDSLEHGSRVNEPNDENWIASSVCRQFTKQEKCKSLCATNNNRPKTELCGTPQAWCATEQTSMIWTKRGEDWRSEEPQECSLTSAELPCH